MMGQPARERIARLEARNGGVALLCLLGLLATSPAAAEEAPWRVGLAKAEITPEEPIRFKGYAARTESSDGVMTPLYAKAMAIEAADGGDRAVLVSADLCVLRRPLARMITRQIMEATGLDRRQILLNVSHTHAGPLVGRSEWFRYDLSETQKQRISAYTECFRRSVVRIVSEALDRMEPATLSHGVGVAEFVMNRRRFRPNGGVRIGVNPRGYADRSVPVLRVRSPEGELRGVLFGCAAHNTTLTGGNRAISGDFAGFAQRRIENERPGVQAMFIAGCAGSANPWPRGNAKLARRHGQALGDQVLQTLDGDMRQIEGPLRVAYDRVELPLAAVPSRDRLRRMAEGPHHLRYNASRMLKALERGEALPSHYEAPLALWRFGDDLMLVGLSGEVVGEYVPLIEEALGPRRLWPAAYCNDVFGYLPTAGVLRRGGYETKGLIVEVGFFSRKAEPVLLQKLRELAEQVGRELPE